MSFRRVPWLLMKPHDLPIRVKFQEMREAFLRAEPYLDLEALREDPSEEQRQQTQAKVPQLAPEALGEVLKLVERLSGKTA